MKIKVILLIMLAPNVLYAAHKPKLGINTGLDLRPFTIGDARCVVARAKACVNPVTKALPESTSKLPMVPGGSASEAANQLCILQLQQTAQKEFKHVPVVVLPAPGFVAEWPLSTIPEHKCFTVPPLNFRPVTAITDDALL